MSAHKTPNDETTLPSGPRADIPAPKVPLVLDPNDPLGLLPLRALTRDLEVTFEGLDFSTFPGSVDLVELGFMARGADFIAVNEREYPSSIPVQQPQTLTIPRSLLIQGAYDVSICFSPSMVNPAESLRKSITIDTTQPNFGLQPHAVIFPDELNGAITESYLTQHGQVIVEVPFYLDVTTGDRAVYFWTDTQDPSDREVEIGEQEFSEQEIIDERLLITVHADEIRAWGHGDRYMYYRLRDRAGNTGPNSRRAGIFVDLSPLPGALLPPEVPLTRKLLDRQQAREGVQVKIERYDFADAAHRVAIDWDGTALAEIPVEPSGFPLETTVPWTAIHARGNGPSRPKVSYRIRLADGSYTASSPDISVALDLTIAGQDHVDAPALLNETLVKLEIRGQKSDLANQLRSVDFGLPARALLVLYDNPQPYEEIDVYWGPIPTPVATYPVKAGDVSGSLVEVEIPWEHILPELQNPNLPVYYVTRNGVNEQYSRKTEVKVSIVIIENLKAPTFPHAGKEGVLHCCSVPRLWEGVTVHIAGNPHFAARDEVIVHWQGCRGLNGTDPIVDAYHEFSKIIDPAEVANGFDIVVADYEKLIAPMVNNGSALVWYILYKGDDGIGRSRPDFVIINRTMPSGEICSPTNEVFCREVNS
ncbi:MULTISPECIES: hypothetical protein [unclassified Pseudomonas]|uniref:hypothetical protein n=1 Tax=unclassified Pseudomonas TaxID=196821 RepID=UPI001B33597B|nr:MULTISPECIES: hypothetical protein [unclassified Pseudomonas]MBP5944791.1 hypothetical protein [Pseudomonas sp. P9(2020)]MBZ9561340.1 hypothetical protein [Pseudomonas sp. P116]